MKHKKIWFTCAVVMSMVTLSGCMGVKELSDEHTEMIAEYSAGVLLRYSDRYDRRLITAEQLSKKPEKENATQAPVSTPVAATPEPEPSSVPPVSGSSVSAGEATGSGGTQGEEGIPEKPEKKDSSKEVLLNQLLHIAGAEFSYQSYRFCDKYTEKGNASPIFAEKGNTLLVVSFRVKNISGKTKKINLMKRKISYPLTIDGNEYLPRINILKNGGLNYLNTKMEKGKTETAVLIYNVSAERKNASEINLVLREGNNKTSIQLK